MAEICVRRFKRSPAWNRAERRQHVEDRQTGLDQCNQFLVEEQEFAAGNIATNPERLGQLLQDGIVAPDVEQHQVLGLQLTPQTAFVLGRIRAFVHLTGIGRYPAEELSHLPSPRRDLQSKK